MKKQVVIIFGGQSTEHDISRRSVATILEHIDYKRYKILTVGVTRNGKWLLFEGNKEAIINDTWEKESVSAFIAPDATLKSLVVFRENGIEYYSIDVVIPVLHGLFGEDGSIQGLLKLAGIPFVGCGILSSAISMDKFYTKILVNTLNIRQAKYIAVDRESYQRKEIEKTVNEQLGYPVFVKPSNSGSSIGVSKATDESTLYKAMDLAFMYDRKVLIEECITGRELECSVLGNLNIQVSDVGEILSADEFYDFDSKYNSAVSETKIPADISEDTKQYIRKSAARIFKCVDGRGLSRVDFFLEAKSGEVVFNEINTFPGFTNISMFPKLFEAEGINITTLIDQMIELGIDSNEL